MLLYKINGTLYPDKNFNFTISAELLGLSPEIHTHAYTDIASIVSTMNGKAAVDHTHNYVTSIYVAEVGTPSLRTISLAIATTSGTPGSLSISDDAVVISYTSAPSDIVVGLLNSNLSEGIASITFSSVDVYTAAESGECVLTITENNYA